MKVLALASVWIIAAICKVNQWIEETSFSLSLCLSVTLSNEQIFWEKTFKEDTGRPLFSLRRTKVIMKNSYRLETDMEKSWRSAAVGSLHVLIVHVTQSQVLPGLGPAWFPLEPPAWLLSHSVRPLILFCTPIANT